MWIVPCGISTGTGASPTVEPFPGFSAECIPDSIEALRKAAAKEPTEPGDVIHIAWAGPNPD